MAVKHGTSRLLAQVQVPLPLVTHVLQNEQAALSCIAQCRLDLSRVCQLPIGLRNWVGLKLSVHWFTAGCKALPRLGTHIKHAADLLVHCFQSESVTTKRCMTKARVGCMKMRQGAPGSGSLGHHAVGRTHSCAQRVAPLDKLPEPAPWLPSRYCSDTAMLLLASLRPAGCNLLAECGHTLGPLLRA